MVVLWVHVHRLRGHFTVVEAGMVVSARMGDRDAEGAEG